MARFMIAALSEGGTPCVVLRESETLYQLIFIFHKMEGVLRLLKGLTHRFLWHEGRNLFAGPLEGVANVSLDDLPAKVRKPIWGGHFDGGPPDGQETPGAPLPGPFQADVIESCCFDQPVGECDGMIEACVVQEASVQRGGRGSVITLKGASKDLKAGAEQGQFLVPGPGPLHNKGIPLSETCLKFLNRLDLKGWP